jgi:hypothetical protein
MTSCLIRDVLVVPPEPTAPYVGWVRVDDGFISAVETGSARQEAADNIVDGEGCALIPGLVNTHAHSHSSLTRRRPGVGRMAQNNRSRAVATNAGAGPGGCARDLRGSSAVGHHHHHGHVPAPRPGFCGGLRDRHPGGDRALCGGSEIVHPNPRRHSETDRDGVAPDGRVRAWVGLHDLESCSDEQIDHCGSPDPVAFKAYPIYSINSSARACTAGDNSRPSAFAVLRLMTNSNLVGRITGRSPGFAPLRMLPT